MHGRLRLLVEAESLLNDAAAAVLFSLALAFALAGGQGLTGRADGLGSRAHRRRRRADRRAFGFGVIFAARGTREHLVELTLTAIAAFGSFLLAEHFHNSGVLATVIAGLIIGNYRPANEKRRDFLTAKGREFMTDFWDFAAFLANSWCSC